MANSNAMTGVPRGLYQMKGLGRRQARAWISDGMTGTAIYENLYRLKAYQPAFETLPTKAEYLLQKAATNS
jgi:hypothetical protein